jgi:hypothetical protein
MMPESCKGRLRPLVGVRSLSLGYFEVKENYVEVDFGRNARIDSSEGPIPEQ